MITEWALVCNQLLWSTFYSSSLLTFLSHYSKKINKQTKNLFEEGRTKLQGKQMMFWTHWTHWYCHYVCFHYGLYLECLLKVSYVPKQGFWKLTGSRWCYIPGWINPLKSSELPALLGVVESCWKRKVTGSLSRKGLAPPLSGSSAFQLLSGHQKLSHTTLVLDLAH